MRAQVRVTWLLIWLCAAGSTSSALTVAQKAVTRVSFQNQCGSQYFSATDPFLNTDPLVGLYFSAGGVQQTDVLQAQWIRPDHSVILDSAWDSVSGDFCFYTSLTAAGRFASRVPGDWQAEVLLNGSVLFSIPFRIVQLGGNTLRFATTLGNATTVAAGEAGTILRTTNGGLSWQALNSGTTSDLEGIAFGNANTGAAVGPGGTILRTIDGGGSWTAKTSGTVNDLRAVAFANADLGLAVGEAGTILRTTDGGVTWAPQFSGASDDLWGVCLAGARNATAVGDNGQILRSNDGGATWFGQASATNVSLFGISCTDSNNATTVGDAGTILRTTDGGASWQAQTSGTLNDLWGVSFTDAKTGTAVGEAGTILRTTDGGVTWSSQTGGGSNWLYAVSFVSANVGAAVGFQGVILQTADGGATWRAPTTAVPLPPGRYRSLSVLGTAVNSSQMAQVFTVNYTDGTSATFRQDMSEWLTPQKFTGETIKYTMSYRNRQDGTKDSRATYLYSYFFPLDENKPVSRLVRPASRNVALLALTLTPASGTAVSVELSSLFNVTGISTDGFAVNGGLDGASFAYSTSLLRASPAPGTTPFQLGPADALNAVSGNWLTTAATVSTRLVIPVDTTKGAFTKIAAGLLLNRQNHTATLLKDGRVLIVGGFPQNANQPPFDFLGFAADTAYLFNPATGALTSAGVTNVPRAGHTATMLADGRVLIAGGRGLVQGNPSVTAVLDSTEIYDPATGKFTVSARMQNARLFHAAIVLADGRVLIAGGLTGPPDDFSGKSYQPVSTTEIFNPTSGVFQPAAKMNEPRSSFTLTALANGKVLAVGGNYADVYDPAQDFFINSLTLANPRARHVAVRLADNRVLIAGGDDGTNPIARAELIAADGSATTPTGNMIEARTSFQATLLNNGLVLLTGSGPAGPLALATAEVYDPAGGSFLRIPAMSFARENHTATKTGDGRVLLAGGNGADGVMEWFTPSSR